MDKFEDLPDLDHWKTVMEFTIEQAALLMAGIDPFDASLESARKRQLSRWKKAHGNSLGIVSAIRQGLISPVICRGYSLSDSGEYTYQVKPSDREIEISVLETRITRASLFGWIASEKVEIAKRPKPVNAVRIQAETARPSTNDVKLEPLMLAYQGHTSEGLEFVEDAIKQFWSTFDPDDHTTAPEKIEIIAYLQSKGATGNVAQAVDLILRPMSMRKVKLKNYKPPTRGDQ